MSQRPELVNHKSVVTPPHAHVIKYPAEIVESWLGCFALSSTFIRFCATLLPLVLVTAKSFECQNLCWREGCENALGEVFH